MPASSATSVVSSIIGGANLVINGKGFSTTIENN
jgi:hypothetical protein